MWQSVYLTGVLSHHYKGKLPGFVSLTASYCCTLLLATAVYYTVGTPCGTTNTQAIFYFSPHVLEHAGMAYRCHGVTCGLLAAENGEESIVVQCGDLGGQTMGALLPIHPPVIV